MQDCLSKYASLAQPSSLVSMSVWGELKPILARLRDQPGILVQYPMLDADEGRQPPFTIWLAPEAIATAEELHRQFGDNVELTVGALPYPPGRQLRRPPALGPRPELLEPHEVVAELDGPAVIRSGKLWYTACCCTTLLTVNSKSRPMGRSPPTWSMHRPAR